MPAASAFNGSASLALRLPRCPSPRCASCAAELRDVRPFRTEQPTASTVVVDCLAKCARCSAKHRGTRRLQRTPQGVRFLSQSFALWTDDDSQSLRPVADALAQAPNSTEPRKHAPPVQVEATKVGRRASENTGDRLASFRRRRVAAAALLAAAAAAVLAASTYLSF